MNNFNKNLIGGSIALLLTAAPGLASATFLDFTINENSVPDVNNARYSAVVADKLNGGYTEVLTIGDTPDSHGNLAFETWAFATFDSLYKNDGVTAVDAYLGSVGDGPGGAGYLIRAMFHSTGLYNVGSNTFTGSTATISMFIDADKDTTVTFGADASVIPDVVNTIDDYLLGEASDPSRLVGIPGTPGAFDFVWEDFLLTDVAGDHDGNGYFISPRPFYVRLNSNGDFDRPNFGPGTHEVTGDISAVFVPEPGTLALLGLGFLGLGSVTRRSKAS